VDRVQDGVERITFAAGIPALEVVQERDRAIDELAILLEKSPEHVVKTVRTLVEDHSRLLKELESMKKNAASVEAERLLKESRKVGRTRLITCKRTEGTEDEAIMLADLLAKSDERIVSIIVLVKETVRVIVSAGRKAVASGIDAGKIARELAPIVGGSGGGKSYFGQGGGADVKKADRVLTKARETVAKMVRSR